MFFVGVAQKNYFHSTQELQLAVNITVCIFNSGILRTYKKLSDECGLIKSIGLSHKLQNLLPRAALITIYKPFIRPHLDYGNFFMIKHIIFFFFYRKLEFIQYNACLAIT